MSCDYDVRCLDCNINHGFDDANHRDELMVAVARKGPALKTFASAVQVFSAEGIADVHVFLEYGRYRVDLGWFMTHGDHRLVAVDEYGRCVDECGETYACTACGDRKTCKRSKGHAGSHLDRRDER